MEQPREFYDKDGCKYVTYAPYTEPDRPEDLNCAVLCGMVNRGMGGFDEEAAACVAKKLWEERSLTQTSG